MRHREPRVWNLRSRFAAQLPRGFDQQEDAAHAGVIRGEAAAIGVERGTTGLVEAQASAFHPRAAFAFHAEAEVLENREHGDRERVVDHRDVELARCYARLAECAGPGLRSGAGGDVAAVLGVLRGLAAAEDPDRLFLAVARDVGRRDHHRAAAIGDHAALEQVQRVGDHARAHHVRDRGLANLEELERSHRRDRFGVSHRVITRRRGDLRELLARGAVLMHVAVRDHRVIRDQRHAAEALEIIGGSGHAGAHARADADRPGMAVRRRAVAEQRDARLALRDVALRVGGVELVGAAADVGRVDHVRVQAEVLGDLQARHAAAIAGVVDRVHVAPAEAGVRERAPGALGLDLQRTHAPFHITRRVLVNPNNRRVAFLCRQRVLPSSVQRRRRLYAGLAALR